ncbi:MAG: DUF2520 domain-containing protein [Bacteroidota bacterium]
MGEINNIIFIGAGNVATNLAFAFHNKGKKILQVISKNLEHAKLLADKVSANYSNILDEINPNADLYIISINDDAIINIASSLKIKNSLIVHTSGSIDMNILQNASTNYGVFYPLQTFTKDIIVDFKNIPFCIEANTSNNSKEMIELAQILSNDVRLINSEERKIIHLAAVFANNFSNYMYLIAEEILSRHDLPFDILKPLIYQTALKVNNQNPEKTQTGPAKRNDLELIEKHLSLLKETPEYYEIYKIISKNIVDKFHN